MDAFFDSSTLDSSAFRRNKPGMSMKINKKVKKSGVRWTPSLTPRLSTPRLSNGTNRECV
jgi:hypothetical protein